MKPILLYGSELWGYEQKECTEIVNRCSCKRFLCVSLKSCNATVLAECGRLPTYIDSQIKCLKYWLKLIELPNYIIDMPRNATIC